MSTGWYVYAIVAGDMRLSPGLTGFGDGEQWIDADARFALTLFSVQN